MICRLSVWQEMQTHKILNWTGRVCGLLIVGFFLIAWRRPVKGGWFMIIGTLLMAGYLVCFSDVRAGLIYSIPTAGVGLCFLAAGGKEFL